MKNQVCKSKSLILSLLLIIGLSFSLSAQEARKEVTGNYNVSKDYTLGIDNKFGNIEIVNWDKNELDVVVEIKVEAKTQEKADKLLEKIAVDIIESGSSVDFITKIDIKNAGEKTKFEVNYTISAPAAMNVKLKQSFGSVFLQSITGDANIAIKHGSLKAKDLTNTSGESAKLDLAFSSCKVKSADALKVEIQHSDIEIGTVNDINGELAFSPLKVESLQGSMVIDAQFSGIEIENVAAQFELVEVTSEFGELSLTMDAKASYSYEVETDFGSLNVPGEVDKGDHKHHMHKETAKGEIGNSPKGKVVAKLKHADLKIN